MTTFTLPSFDWSTLAARVKSHHYELDSASCRDLSENTIISGALREAYLCLKLLAGTRIASVPKDPDAVDEAAKLQMKLVANTLETVVVDKINVKKAPPTAQLAIAETFGSKIDTIAFPDDIFTFVTTFDEAASEVVIYKYVNVDGTVKNVYIKFPAAHLWPFCGDRSKANDDKLEKIRVKWAFNLVPGYMTWASKESHDVNPIFGQHEFFQFLTNFEKGFDKARRDGKTIDFVAEKPGDDFTVVWPSNQQILRFKNGIESAGNGNLDVYRRFLDEFISFTLSNITNFTLYEWIRVMIFHHCKVAAFINTREDFYQISYLGKLVSAQLDAIVPNSSTWTSNTFEDVVDNLDEDVKDFIEEARRKGVKRKRDD
jgi:hypothetical protein